MSVFLGRKATSKKISSASCKYLSIITVGFMPGKYEKSAERNEDVC